MGFTRKALLLSGLLALSWIGPAAARSPADSTRDLALTYRVYYGGFEVLRLVVDIRLAAEDYKLEMNFRTLGLIGTLFPWTMKAYARGRLTKDGVHPVAAGQRNSWRGRQRWVELRYPGRSPVVADAHPAVKDDKPSAKSLIDTIDLASAIFAMTRQLDQHRGCGRRLPVFDGRRRYDLLFKGLGDGAIRRSGYSVYAGPVTNCRAEMDRLAGFKTRQNSYGGWGEADRTATVSMGRPFIDAPPVPVRIEIQTRWGDIMAHLTQAKLAANGNTRKLALAVGR
ncbi:MAG: DUF3108 domain-containing protein [Rhodospirillales bacterium]|nr:DUF3108 domain-containing protein [Rhodospirillales bacterium]